MLAQSTGQQLTCDVCRLSDAARVPVKACTGSPDTTRDSSASESQGGGTVDHSLLAACAVDDVNKKPV